MDYSANINYFCRNNGHHALTFTGNAKHITGSLTVTSGHEALPVVVDHWLDTGADTVVTWWPYAGRQLPIPQGMHWHIRHNGK
jgi:hypothetical protein